MRESLKEMYLDWVNNYLTVEAFAEAKGLSIHDAKLLIQLGDKYSEIDVK